MNRLYLAAACLSGALAFGCGPKEFGSVCTEVPAPAECMTACDPTPGAASACPSGFHCSPDGLCDAQCTVGGGQCGDGYTCTSDGYCVDDGSGSGSGAPDASCPAVTFTPMPTTPSIGLVLDQSGSMYTNTEALEPPQTRLRGDARSARRYTTGVVTQLETKAYFGSKLYTCNGQREPDPRRRRAHSPTPRHSCRRSTARSTRWQNTPTAAAHRCDACRRSPRTRRRLDRRRSIVLATDGEPNSCDRRRTSDSTTRSRSRRPQQPTPRASRSTCSPSQRVPARTSSSRERWPGLGDRTCPYYPATTQPQLQAAFQTIINGVISCDLSLTSSIDATQAMNGTLTINGVTLMYGTDWTLVGGNVIRVQGSACNTLKTTTNPSVSATFPCGSVIF